MLDRIAVKAVGPRVPELSFRDLLKEIELTLRDVIELIKAVNDLVFWKRREVLLLKFHVLSPGFEILGASGGVH